METMTMKCMYDLTICKTWTIYLIFYNGNVIFYNSFFRTPNITEKMRQVRRQEKVSEKINEK